MKARSWLGPVLLLGIGALYQLLVFLGQLSDVRFGNPILDSRYQIDWAFQLLSGQAGERLFFQSPLYSYLVAGFIQLFGWSALALGLLQLALSLSVAGLVYLACSQLGLGRAARWFATSAILFWPVLPFYAADLNKTTLEIFLHACVLTAVLWAVRIRGEQPVNSAGNQALPASAAGASWSGCYRWLVVGLLVGLASLVRGSFQLLPLLLVLFLGLARWRSILFLIVAFCVPVGWAVGHNSLIAGRIMPVQTSSGYNLYLGNNPYDQTGTQQETPATTLIPMLEELHAKKFAEARLGRALDPGEVDAYYRSLVVDHASSRPGLFLAGLREKMRRYVHRTELPDNVCFDCESKERRLLGWNPLQFSVLMALLLPALALIFLANRELGPVWRTTGVKLAQPGQAAQQRTGMLWRGLEAHWFPAAYGVFLCLSVIAFFINSRVRAGHAAVWIVVLAQGLSAVLALHAAGRLSWRRALPVLALLLPGLPILFASDLPDRYHPDGFTAKKAVVEAELGRYQQAQATAGRVSDPEVQRQLEAYLSEIRAGKVASGEYEPLLSPIIPRRR